eukprot:g8329.t1
MWVPRQNKTYSAFEHPAEGVAGWDNSYTHQSTHFGTSSFQYGSFWYDNKLQPAPRVFNQTIPGPGCDCAHRDWPLSKAEKLDLLKVIDQNEKKIIQKELKMDQNVILKLERETRRKSMQRDYYKRRLSHYEDLSNRRSAPPSTPSQVGGWEASEDAQSLHSDAGESSLAERQLMYEDSMEMTSSAQDGSPLPIVFSEQLQNGKAKLKYLGFSTPMSKEGGRDDVVRTFHPAVAEVGKLDIDAAETENDADGMKQSLNLIDVLLLYSVQSSPKSRRDENTPSIKAH